jgi:predicted DNA-binding transcriptional regulator AlpA
MSKEDHPDAFVRLKQIIGDHKTGTPGILPIGASTWWAGVKTGRYPKPTKPGPRITAWRAADIINLNI